MPPSSTCLVCGEPATVRAQIFEHKSGGSEHCGWRGYKDVPPERAEDSPRIV
jgi:hypothetical protein